MSTSDKSRGRVDLARQQQEIDRIRAEKSALAPQERRVTTRAVARILADTRVEGRLGRFVVHSDEPVERGGDDTGPSPLQFLMAAVAFWLLTQVARFAPLYDVEVGEAKADVRATFFNSEKYDVDDAPAYFEQVTVQLAIESPAPAQAVSSLVAHAERACHAAHSLRNPVPVTFEPTLNGLPLT